MFCSTSEPGRTRPTLDVAERHFQSVQSSAAHCDFSVSLAREECNCLCTKVYKVSPLKIRLRKGTADLYLSSECLKIAAQL